jgi:murein DD-endopeptidase MepM/ murein hydrolase activator NlpD
MSAPIEELVQVFPVWIEPDFLPNVLGPTPVVYADRRPCDRPPYMPTFGAGTGAGRVNRRTGETAAHDGQDIGAAYGAAVVATCPGTVFATWHYPRGDPPHRPGAGTLPFVNGYVRVLGPEDHVLYYAHLWPVYALPGQAVRTGQLLGRVWHAGPGRGNPAHLHYQIRGPSPWDPSVGGALIDPLPRLRDLHRAGGWRAPHPPLVVSLVPRLPFCGTVVP